MKFSQIKDNDVANGLGITMSLWTQGCPHHCKGCFNKDTWTYNKGKEFSEDDAQYILNNLNKDGVNRNFSVLGGEPLCPENISGVIDICKKVKEKFPEKLIFIWTGYNYEGLNEDQREILMYIDVLIDGRFELNKRNISLKWRGSANQRVIDVKKSIDSNNIILYK